MNYSGILRYLIELIKLQDFDLNLTRVGSDFEYPFTYNNIEYKLEIRKSDDSYSLLILDQPIEFYDKHLLLILYSEFERIDSYVIYFRSLCDIFNISHDEFFNKLIEFEVFTNEDFNKINDDNLTKLVSSYEL